MDHTPSNSVPVSAQLLLSGVDVEPRDYQLRVAGKAIELMTKGAARHSSDLRTAANSVLIESPTGSGKTVMGLTISRYFQHTMGYSVGWSAMRRNLLTQVAAENDRWNFGVELELISMFDKHPPAVDFLVVDEAQHDAAMSMANLHSIIRPAKVLGLSATPYRTDRVTLCFEQAIRDADIHHLIQEGHLSAYHHYTIPEYSPDTVSDCYVREPQRWGKSLMFFRHRTDCQQCQVQLSRRGVVSEVVTAETDRERQIHDFANGRIQVLLSMMILTEGFDCPALQTVFCRPSGKPCTVQMCGRVFRKHPGCAVKQIVQCRQTSHPFPRSAAPAEQYVWSGRQWNTLKMNSQIAGISANAMRAIARSRAELPKLITENRPTTQPWWQRWERDVS